MPLDVADLYRRHGGMVFRRARSIVGDDEQARDVVQDVFLIMHREQGRMVNTGLVSWLYTTTTRRCFNELRNTSTRSRLLQAQSATSAHPAHSENLVLLRGVVRELDEQLAFVAIYRFVDEMTHAEIATQLGCSRRHVGDVLVRLEEKFAKARAVAL
jgi:RNA polymerase sigma factor (sigma-70 family)